MQLESYPSKKSLANSLRAILTCSLGRMSEMLAEKFMIVTLRNTTEGFQEIGRLAVLTLGFFKSIEQES